LGFGFGFGLGLATNPNSTLKPGTGPLSCGSAVLGGVGFGAFDGGAIMSKVGRMGRRRRNSSTRTAPPTPTW
jgi:hypothetical protein